MVATYTCTSSILIIVKHHLHVWLNVPIILRVQSFVQEDNCIDTRRFEQILRTSTGEQLDKEEIKMVSMGRNTEKICSYHGFLIIPMFR